MTAVSTLNNQPTFIDKITTRLNLSTNSTATTASAPTYQSDQANTTPMQAGNFKRISDSIGEFFSDVADKMHFGETYELIDREFRQIDVNYDRTLNYGEFLMGTMNPFDFRVADTNYDNQISKNEYVSYRKTTLERQFESKDQSADGFLNVAEVGAVGRFYLAQRDPRVDANKDGFMSKREFVRSHLTLGISIRDLLGL